MEEQKELVEFIKWISANVKGFENASPEEIVDAINGMAQSKEGEASLKKLFEQFKAQKPKFAPGGVVDNVTEYKIFPDKNYSIVQRTIRGSKDGSNYQEDIIVNTEDPERDYLLKREILGNDTTYYSSEKGPMSLNPIWTKDEIDREFAEKIPAYKRAFNEERAMLNNKIDRRDGKSFNNLDSLLVFKQAQGTPRVLFGNYSNGGQISRHQNGGVVDTTNYITLRPIITTENGYPELIGEDRTVYRNYPTYHYRPGDALSKKDFYTTDGYTRRIIGSDTTYLKRRPISYTLAGNPEDHNDAKYVHLWEDVMPTSWLRAMFNREPDEIGGAEEYQNGGELPYGTSRSYSRDSLANTTTLKYPDGGRTHQVIYKPSQDTVYVNRMPNGRIDTISRNNGVWTTTTNTGETFYGPETTRQALKLTNLFNSFR